jgi:hypothetical protein
MFKFEISINTMALNLNFTHFLKWMWKSCKIMAKLEKVKHLGCKQVEEFLDVDDDDNDRG